jgi:drug/metabolite transporter (DMT)-like permease
MALLAALLAIAMWASLASLTVSLSGIPPLFLTGASLFIGGALSIPWVKHWTFNWRALGVGVYGQLTYHVLYIIALRTAPAANANLVHYAWPLLTVLMAPLAGKGGRLKLIDIGAALVAFAGLIVATYDEVELSTKWHVGYGFAFAAAVVWATYSIAESRSKDSSAIDVGPACMVSGLLALTGHHFFEQSTALTNHQWLLMFALGIGPTGGAFYLWSWALRRGDTRVIGVISYATPILSTATLSFTQGKAPTSALICSAALVTLASLASILVHRRAKVLPESLAIDSPAPSTAQASSAPL